MLSCVDFALARLRTRHILLLDKMSSNSVICQNDRMEIRSPLVNVMGAVPF